MYLIVEIASYVFCVIAVLSVCAGVAGIATSKPRLFGIALVVFLLAVVLAIVMFGWAYDLAF